MAEKRSRLVARVGWPRVLFFAELIYAICVLMYNSFSSACGLILPAFQGIVLLIKITL